MNAGANVEAQTKVTSEYLITRFGFMTINNSQDGSNPLMLAEQHWNVSALLVSLLTTAAKWRRRRVSVWLSSALSGGDNILYRLPTDVARICGSYL